MHLTEVLMEVNADDIVLSGEDATSRVEVGDKGRSIVLGPGLRRIADKVVICNSGVFRKKGNHAWVDCHKYRYIPVKKDLVIGVVVAKSGDYFKVDIGCSDLAELSYLAFEGATKKNRPNVEVGDVIYARLLKANRDMEPELVCVNSNLKEAEMGVLGSDGFIFSCSLHLAKKLRSQYRPLFDKIGKVIPYEIAIGSNGKIWIRTKSKSVKNTIAICNLILASEFKTYEESEALCTEFINKHRIVDK